MANVYAIKSGNWSDPTVWNTGALPAAEDDVWANGFIVDIDISVEVVSLKNAAFSPIVAGGFFNINDGLTLTCTSTALLRNAALTNGLIKFSANFPASANIVGNFGGGSPNNGQVTITNDGTGTLNVTGYFEQGAANYAAAVRNNNTGVVNVTGNAQNTTFNATASTVYTNRAGLGTPTQQIGTMNVVGNMSGGLCAWSWATLNHTGSVTALGTAFVIGSTANGVTCQVNLTGPIINNGSTSALYAFRFRFQPGTPARWRIFQRDSNDQDIIDRTLYTAGDYPDMPATTDVRNNVTYGPGNDLTGSLVMPAPSSVRSGVPTDDTVGTAVLDPSAFWNVAISSLNVSGSIGERLKNVSTVATIGDQLAAG
jgi:hypothetical protein